MNKFQQNLYIELMNLSEGFEAFYYKDFPLEDTTYRIFNYRLASYTDFLQPGALECRGIMFEVCGDEAIRLASFPMEKFFNLNENPFTMGLDLSEIQSIELKVDGSLISTFHHNGRLLCKSKESINSYQAQRSNVLIERNETLHKEIEELARHGMTVNMEYLPRADSEHRVVIGHQEEGLVVLSVRNNETGAYHSPHMLTAYPALLTHWVKHVTPDDPEEFVKQIGNMEDVEGYIVYLPHICFKAKTLWYLTQHRAKDSVNSPRRLYEAVIAEATDDLRSLFFSDAIVLEKIDAMEQKVGHWYNELVEQVETFYDDNQDLERKWYAIKGQKELPKIVFGLAMQKYTGREINYKEFMIKKWKEFGIKDEEETENGVLH